MAKSDSCICLIPLFPLFNSSEVPLFQQMTKEDSSLLFSTLFENYIDVLNETKENCSIFYMLDKKDREHLPPEFIESLPDIHWFDSYSADNEIKNLNDKYFKKFHNNLIIFSHSMGVSSADIKKIFSLLEIEDESVFIGRDDDERIALLGFNSYNEEIMGNITEDRNHYNEILIKAGKEENFVHTLSNFMLIEGRDDFKKLYTELSKKESLQYCTQRMHEKFTHLFIEYKELLK